MSLEKTAALRRQLLGKVRDDRLAAVPLVAALPKAEALPLLRKGVRHWDRDLRRACATELTKLGGIDEASKLFTLAKSKLLPKPFVVKQIAQVRTPEYVAKITKKVTESNRLLPELVLADAFRKDEVAKPLWAERALRLRAEFVEAERKREAERAIAAAKAARKAAEDKAKALLRCDLEGLLAATGAKPSLLRALFGVWTRNNGCFAEMYEQHEIPKRHGGVREIQAPDAQLKALQRSILDGLLSKYPLHSACHGFRTERSTGTNAAPHVGHDVVVNLDLRNFFPTITSRRVSGLLDQLEVPGGIVGRRFLVDVMTLEGKLPQGAPTSPAVANLIARRLDSRLTGLATKANVTYTRYADDLTFSGTTEVLSLLPRIRDIIRDEGFEVAEEKTRVLRKGVRQDVTGLTVNSRVSVPRVLRRRLRAAVHHARTGKEPYWKEEKLTVPALKGHLAYLHGVNPGDAAKLLGELTASR